MNDESKGAADLPPDDNSVQDDQVRERARAAAALRRESLAANKSQGQAKAAMTVGTVALFGLVAVFALKRLHSSDTSSPQPATSVKIDERPAPAAPLSEPKAAAAAPASSAASSPVVADTQSDDQLAAERRRREIAAAEAETARLKAEQVRQIRLKSDIFDSEGASGGDSDQPTGGDGAGAAGNGGERAVNDPNSAFARSVGSEGIAVAKVQKFDRTECKVMPGQIIEATLRPRATSDLPGAVTFLVTRDTFGHQGRIPLIPWGTVITGRTNSVVRPGQERTFMPTATALLPDGQTVQLGSSVSDQLGTSGIDGDVDRHVGQIIGMSAVLSILGAGAATAGVSSDGGNNSAAMYRQGVQQSFAQSSQQLLGGYANIPPTITNRQGTRVRIQVEQVLDFSEYCGSHRVGRTNDTD
ncbi:TrbI/VirB10 family protein [Burkholderia vietnamiensis]|uniref:TrbI/VirB10 family protein n=1 Tax=Burkholderia vietnamiensis TaxID=60552 RepID=UPI000A9D8B55|nr:TrbI/VirB10 family protein [Burkholderia vietnamiensis]MCO1351608.1 TrbI/VirB10 family protein [Burkholderia vietnamiensis]MCO1430200.1 TrbI/VirB10 family protein [Burkholderia vietnamiensis]UQN50966.1 TrbI/VirB10 family protein [Burkholderia vietnamiensis]HDR9036918.1 TrbI/VirB10 family protein [Burkholderia vietnamiensis]HDR9070087.1 TrbI/VirB10 family protein [Burkholderia vietnamiensis]